MILAFLGGFISGFGAMLLIVGLLVWRIYKSIDKKGE